MSGRFAGQWSACEIALHEAVQETRLGHRPSDDLQVLVDEIDDPQLSAQYLICSAAFLANTGDPTASQAVSGQVKLLQDSGLDVGATWRWHDQNNLSVTAFDCREPTKAWLHALNTLEIAQRIDDPLLLGRSRSTLAYLSIQSGLYHKGHEHLVAAEGRSLPADIAVGIDLMFARVFATWGDTERSQHHLGLADKTVSQTPGFRFTRLLVVLAALCIDGGEFLWAQSHLAAMYKSASRADTDLARFEIRLVHAKLTHSLGYSSDAVERVQIILDSAGEAGWIRSVALVIQATMLRDAGEFRRCLDVLEDELLNPLPPMRDVQVHLLRRDSYKSLGLWRQAAEVHEELEMSQRRRSVNVQQVYEMQEREQLATVARAHNQRMRAKNDELLEAIERRKTIMSMSGEEFHVPLQFVLADLQEMAAGADEARMDRVVRRILVTLGGLDDVAEQLSLLGQNAHDDLHLPDAPSQVSPSPMRSWTGGH